MKNFLKIAAIAVLVIIAVKLALTTAYIGAAILVAWLLVTFTTKGKVWGKFASANIMGLIDKKWLLNFKIYELEVHKEEIMESGVNMVKTYTTIASKIEELGIKAAEYIAQAKKAKEDGNKDAALEYLNSAKQMESLIEMKQSLHDSLKTKATKTNRAMTKIDTEATKLRSVLEDYKIAKTDIDVKRLLKGVDGASVTSIINDINSELAGENFKNDLLGVKEDEAVPSEELESDYEKL